MDYRILNLKRKYDLSILEENIKFTIEVADLIKNLNSPVEKDAYIDKISRDTGIAKTAIEKEIANKESSKDSRNSKNVEVRKQRQIKSVESLIFLGNFKAELDLLRIIMLNMEYFDITKNKLSADDFTKEETKLVYKLILQAYKSTEELDIGDFKNSALNQGISEDFLDDLILEEVEYKPTDLESVVEDLIGKLVLNKYLNERNQIIKNIERVEKSEDNSLKEEIKIEDLFIQLIHVNNKIKQITHE